MSPRSKYLNKPRVNFDLYIFILPYCILKNYHINQNVVFVCIYTMGNMVYHLVSCPFHNITVGFLRLRRCEGPCLSENNKIYWKHVSILNSCLMIYVAKQLLVYTFMKNFNKSKGLGLSLKMTNIILVKSCFYSK